MELIKQSWEWLQKPINPLQIIEQAGRTCYKSEDLITEDSADKFVNMIINRGHETVIEHVTASVKFITNRGVTHELVRHRPCSYSQESTRYVNYKGDMQFILPVWLEDTLSYGKYTYYHELSLLPANEALFIGSCLDSEKAYISLLDQNWWPEQAREVLPNALKTEIVITCNLREFRHIFNLRCSKKAHPQIRALMLECLAGFHAAIPVVFDDLYEKYLTE